MSMKMSQASLAKPDAHFEHASLARESSIPLVALQPKTNDDPVRRSLVYAIYINQSDL